MKEFYSVPWTQWKMGTKIFFIMVSFSHFRLEQYLNVELSIKERVDLNCFLFIKKKKELFISTGGEGGRKHINIFLINYVQHLIHRYCAPSPLLTFPPAVSALYKSLFPHSHNFTTFLIGLLVLWLQFPLSSSTITLIFNEHVWVFHRFLWYHFLHSRAPFYCYSFNPFYTNG